MPKDSLLGSCCFSLLVDTGCAGLIHTFLQCDEHECLRARSAPGIWTNPHATDGWGSLGDACWSHPCGSTLLSCDCDMAYPPAEISGVLCLFSLPWQGEEPKPFSIWWTFLLILLTFLSFPLWNVSIFWINLSVKCSFCFRWHKEGKSSVACLSMGVVPSAGSIAWKRIVLSWWSPRQGSVQGRGEEA